MANDNGDLGIEAVSGVTDGGGNRARGNGNPAQCVGCEVFLTAINQRPSPGVERAVVGFRGG